MPRLQQVHRDEVESVRVLAAYDRFFGDRDPVIYPGTPSGAPGNWWTVFALDPRLSELVLDRVEWQTAPQRRIDPLLRELCLTRAGWARGSKFVFSQHCKRLRKVGASDEQVSAIRDWASATCYSKRSVRYSAMQTTFSWQVVVWVTHALSDPANVSPMPQYWN
ncbi:carboxymuconolactone decarboxylase family protein [Paraburkholderia panacisoli]|uniref:carboxymuconolactone decarboxylase family protein n=1 Tax=Paraburkholderia panacisoli TaxID=2603818 RepID=UPI001CB6CE5A|nr:carboxymuconolactone decarboxylase family protein [Paraburkholderia panacisoli]